MRGCLGQMLDEVSVVIQIKDTVKYLDIIKRFLKCSTTYFNSPIWLSFLRSKLKYLQLQLLFTVDHLIMDCLMVISAEYHEVSFKLKNQISWHWNHMKSLQRIHKNDLAITKVSLLMSTSNVFVFVLIILILVSTLLNYPP